MLMERETAVEAGIALAGVVVFVAIVIAGGEISASGLTQQGAYAVITAIVAFVVVMAGAGFFLSSRQKD